MDSAIKLYTFSSSSAYSTFVTYSKLFCLVYLCFFIFERHVIYMIILIELLVHFCSIYFYWVPNIWQIDTLIATCKTNKIHLWSFHCHREDWLSYFLKPRQSNEIYVQMLIGSRGKKWNCLRVDSCEEGCYFIYTDGRSLTNIWADTWSELKTHHANT